MKKLHHYLPIIKRQSVAKNEPKMNRREMENISRALKAKVNAAKAGIIALGPKLLAEFEVQLSVTYPSSGDPVWMEALNEVYKVYEVQRARVEARCEELRIPERFRPTLTRPGWSDGWKSSCSDFKDYRAEMRRLAAIQIEDAIKSRLAHLEMNSANIQYELASHGCITDAAQDFLAKLPAIESLIPRLKVSEVEALIEGRATAIMPALLNASEELAQLPSSDEKVS